VFKSSHCNTLQHVKSYCNTLPHCATNCITGECILREHIVINIRIATHCNTLQHTATLCSTLQHRREGILCERIAAKKTHCNTLQHVKLYCNTLPDTANTAAQALEHLVRAHRARNSHCNTLQHAATFNRTLQHDRERILCESTAFQNLTATHFNTLQLTATRCNTGTGAF